MITIDGTEMVDVAEAARLARRTPETIRRWLWSGRLASVKHGNKHLLARADVLLVVGTHDSASRTASLAEWATTLPQRSSAAGATAADLVFEDRESRARR